MSACAKELHGETETVDLTESWCKFDRKKCVCSCFLFPMREVNFKVKRFQKLRFQPQQHQLHESMSRDTCASHHVTSLTPRQ